MRTAAVQVGLITAVLALVLARLQKDDHHGWMDGLLRATIIPFIIVLLLPSSWSRCCPVKPNDRSFAG